jgi:hypothetical protein
MTMLLTEETRLRRAALVYVRNLHNELTQQNGRRRSGPRIKRSSSSWASRNCAGRDWAASAEIDEATLTLRRLPQDALYHRVRSHLEQIMGPPVFATAKQPGR